MCVADLLSVHGKLEKFLIKINHSLFGKAESPPYLLDTDNHVVIILTGAADTKTTRGIFQKTDRSSSSQSGTTTDGGGVGGSRGRDAVRR